MIPIVRPLPAIPTNCGLHIGQSSQVRVTNLEMRVYGLSMAANQRWAILRTRRIPRDSAEELIPLGIHGYIFSRSCALHCSRSMYSVNVKLQLPHSLPRRLRRQHRSQARIPLFHSPPKSLPLPNPLQIPHDIRILLQSIRDKQPSRRQRKHSNAIRSRKLIPSQIPKPSQLPLHRLKISP